MTVELYCKDYYREAGPVLGHDCVLSDPPYDQLPNPTNLILTTPSNVVLFCAHDKRPQVQGDEILHWVKQPSTKNTARKCSRFVEEIHVYRKGSTFNRLHWSCMTGVFFDTLIDYPSLHPWQKPLSLMEKLVLIYSNEGDTVWDPFMGSGTTGVAAVKHGRSFIGWEKDPATFEIARTRIDRESNSRR